MSSQTNTPKLPAIADFSDRISPMIVKELRQGLRTKTFTSVFLGLQVILVFSLLILSEATKSGSQHLVSVLLFSIFGLVALVVQPFRATGTIESERKRNTLELTSLTRLSPWRIVIGKWASLCSQTFILFVSIVPYLVLRYFLGGMNLFVELLILSFILLLSCCLTALVIGLSSISIPLIRTIAPLFISLGIYFLGVSSIRGNLSSSVDLNASILASLIVVFFASYTFLEIATNSISSRNQSRALLKRCIAIVVAMSAAIFTVLNGNSDFALFSFLLIPLFSLLLLTEEPAFYGLTKSTFSRIFLAKGWQSSFVTFLLCIAITGIPHFLENDTELTISYLVVIYAALFPLVILTFFKKKKIDYTNTFMLTWVMCIIFSAMSAGLFELLNNNTAKTVSHFSQIIPGFGISEIMDFRRPEQNIALIIQACLILISLLIISIMALRKNRELKEEYNNLYMEDEAITEKEALSDV